LIPQAELTVTTQPFAGVSKRARCHSITLSVNATLESVTTPQTPAHLDDLVSIVNELGLRFDLARRRIEPR